MSAVKLNVNRLALCADALEHYAKDRLEKIEFAARRFADSPGQGLLEIKRLVAAAEESQATAAYIRERVTDERCRVDGNAE